MIEFVCAECFQASVTKVLVFMLRNWRTSRSTSSRSVLVPSQASPGVLNHPTSQLAKRKADELEDFNAGRGLHLSDAISSLTSIIDNTELEAGIPPEVVEEGNKLIEQLLRTWASKVSNDDSEDVDMDAGEYDDSPEAQVEELRKCVEEFRPQIEDNQWVQRVLASLI